jgi:putative ABC transport system permease protein
MGIRYALRQLRKSPGFVIIAVLTLALGIGANTAIFSFVNAWVIRPLPYPNPDQLVALFDREIRSGRIRNIAPATYRDWIDQGSAVFDQAAGWSFSSYNLTGDGEPEKLRAIRATTNFFEILGAQPALGRVFTRAEETPGPDRVVVLSQPFWRDRFNSDRSVLGRSLMLDGNAYTVIGVMPADFHLPLTGRVHVWLPLALNREESAQRSFRWIHGLARLKAGVSVPQAASALEAVAARLETQYPESNKGTGVVVRSLHEEIGRHSGNEPVTICFAIVGLVLLIACANVANLLLTRATGRRKEVGVRLAIGASRWQIIRQFLTETLILFGTGGVAGVLFAVWGVDWMTSAIPFQNRGYLPNFGHIAVDLTVLGYSMLLALATGILFGLAPALQSTRVDLNETLKNVAGRAASGFRGGRMRRVLVAAEIALAVMVVVSAGLLVNSFVRMVRVDLGFDAQHAATAEIELAPAAYRDVATAGRFFEQVVEKLRESPGVDMAAASQFSPFSATGSATAPLFIEGRPAAPPGQAPTTRYTSVTSGYLRTMDIRLTSGRGISDQDSADTQRVAVINETLARRYFAGEDPIGQNIRVGRGSANVLTVVGVVKDVKFVELIDPPENQVYLAMKQSPVRYGTVVARTTGEIAPVAAAIRSSIRSVDAGVPVSRILTIDRLISEEVAPWRILTQIMGFFAVLAMVLAALGIYGVMSYAVSTRTREIGVRMALGARSADVLKMVIGQGFTIVLVGLSLGLVGSIAMTRLMKNILFSVSPGDPATFVSVAALLTAVALAACWIPARKASRVDPMMALRYE